MPQGGSPPRMRGKPERSECLLLESRITPADAGKTFGDRFLRNLTKDHPRGCGENRPFRRNAVKVFGSPPRMRGKRQNLTSLLYYRRITPADAGKTCCFATANPYHIGSPPRMRGKRKRIKKDAIANRITPADAGKTLKRSFRNQPFCFRAVQISFNFSNSLNVSLQSGSAR